MGAIQTDNHSLFSLRLEQGVGRLILVDRRIADHFVVAEMNMALDDVPQHLDMTTGVEAFRHHRGQLDKLLLHFDDQDLTRFLEGRTDTSALENLEVRIVDGDVLVLGELVDEVNVPFLIRARIESVGVSGARALLMSAYETRLYGPSELTAPQLVARVIRASGMGQWMNGPTAILLDPLAPLLSEICAELGWKLPGRRHMKITRVEATAGRVRLVFSREVGTQAGPRIVTSSDGSARARRFWADSEAKNLYRPTEKLIEDGQLERAILHYARQLEIHPEQSFLVARLLQLQVVHRPSMPEALLLAQNRLAAYADDLDALNALAVTHWRRNDKRLAAETFGRIATILEGKGEVLEAAQVRCAVATVLAEIDPEAALTSLNAALALRRRLPGALKHMADLQARAGDWVAAIRTQEAILMAEDDPDKRLSKLVQLGYLAVNEAGDLEAAERFFDQALDVNPDDIDALRGAALTHERRGRFLAAVRTLDRAARLLQTVGDNAQAAETIVQLGDLWKKEPKEGIETATLRYRQALLLQPGHPGALNGLADTAVAQGDFPRARKALEELLRAAETGKAKVKRSQVHLRLGEVLAHAGDSSRAALFFQKAMADGDDVAETALDALEALHQSDERWDDVARILELGLHRYPDSPQADARIVRLVNVLVQHQKAYERAIQLLEVVTSAPTEPTLMRQLVELYRQIDDKPRLSSALQSLATLIDDPEEHSTLMTERADLLRIYLNDTDAAIEAFTQALSCHPNNLSALHGLMDIYRERERHADLVPLLVRAIDVALEDEQIRLGLELGRVYEGLGRRSEAIEVLERVRNADQHEVDATRLLADLYMETGQLELALERFGAVYEAYTLEGYDEPVAPFLNLFAGVHLALRQPGPALELYERAIELDPEYLESYDNAQDLLLQQRSLDDVVEFLIRGLDQAAHGATRHSLCLRIGRYLWRELRRPAEAKIYLDEAAQLSPGDAGGRALRLEVATALSEWPLVARLMHEQLDEARPGERPALLVRLAKLSLSELGRPQHGVELLQTALRLDETHIPALSLLGDHAFQTQAWGLVAHTYEQLRKIEGAHTRPDDRYRLGLARLALGEFEAAFEHLSAVRSGGYDFEGMTPAFLRACIETSRFNQVVATLPALEDEARTDQSTLWRLAGRLLSDVAGYEDYAQLCWSKLLDLDPDDPESLSALGRLAAFEAGEQVESVDAVDVPTRQAIDDEGDSTDAEALPVDERAHSAALGEGESGDQDHVSSQADSAFTPTVEPPVGADRVPSGFQAVGMEQSGSVDDEHRETDPVQTPVPQTGNGREGHADDTINQASAASLQSGADDVLTETGPLPPVVSSPPVAAEPMTNLGTTEVLPDVTETQPLPVIKTPATTPLPTEVPDEATITVTGMARIRIPDPDAASARTDGRPPRSDVDVRDLTAAQTDVAPADGGVVNRTTTADSTSRTAPDEAVEDGLLDAFSVDDDELPPMAERHRPSADEIERPEEAAEALRTRIARSETADERAQLYRELAELVRDRLHDPDTAIGAFEAVLDEAEAGDEHWTEAMEALEDLRAVRAEWPALVKLYDRRIEAGIGDRNHLLLVKASVLKTMGAMSEALAAAQAGQDGSLRALELIVGLLEEMDMVDEAADRLLEGLSELSKHDAAHRRWRAGDLLKAQKPDAALALLIEARDVLNDEVLIDECVQLARVVDQPKLLVDALLKQAAATNTEGAFAVRHSGLIYEAATIALDQLEDLEFGRRLLEQALSVWEDNVDALSRLAEVLESLNDTHALVSVYERELAMLLPGPHRGKRGMKLIGALLETDRSLQSDSPIVQGVLDDVLGTEFEADARALIERIDGRRSTGPAPIDATLEAPVALTDAGASTEALDPIDALLARGQALMQTAGGLHEAIAVFEEVLGLEPASLAAYEQLAHLYGDAGMHEALCGILERHAAIVGPQPARAALLLKKAHIAFNSLGATDVAAEILERILTDTAAELNVVEAALDTLLNMRARKLDLERIRRILDERIQFSAGTPDEPGLLTLRARLLNERLGRKDVGRADLEAAIKLDASHAKAQLALGLMILDLGPAHLALTHFRHILGTDARALSDSEARRLVTGLRRALELSGRTGDYAQVKEQLISWRAEIDLTDFPPFEDGEG
ncbi:MAG: tetratricopeptide repeat protein [Myxococcota bacterium]|nr:tetratricopeptide repeat protein [Myxococcota bacterium]